MRTEMRGLAPTSRGNFIKQAANGIGGELFHNLRKPALLADLLFGEETFSEKFRAPVDGSMHCCFRCPGTSYLARAMVIEAKAYDRKCGGAGKATRYSQFSSEVKSVCKLETGVSLGGHKGSHHIKRLSGRGFNKCMFELDWGQHYAPDGKRCMNALYFESSHLTHVLFRYFTSFFLSCKLSQICGTKDAHESM